MKYPDLTKVNKVLVIKLRHLGDVLLSTALFHLLKKRLPNSEIHAYVYQNAKEILANNSNVSKIIAYDQKIKKRSLLAKIAYELKLINRIRKEKYDLVINLTEGDRGAIAAFFSKAKYKVGQDPQKSGFLGKKHIFDFVVKKCASPRHAVEQNLDSLRRIGIFPLPEEKQIAFPVSKDTRKKVENLITQNNYPLGGYIIIHAAARWKFKCWQHFPLLISKLLQRKEKIILTGASDPEEVALTDNLCKNFDVLNLAGKTSISELAALIDLSKMLICVDSLPFHIASALKKRVVCIFGPTSEKIWGPWQNDLADILSDNISCRPCALDGCGGSKMSECMEKVKVKQVLDAVYKENSSPK